MKHYEFIARARNGALRLQYSAACTGDEHALATGREVMQLDPAHSRLEIWRDDECIYDGSPSTWPVRTVSDERAAVAPKNRSLG